MTNVSPNGVWLLIGNVEKFLSFAAFPWFRDAPVSAIMRVERPSVGHLDWPALDVDLDEESIERPEKFPLVSSQRSDKSLQQSKSPTTVVGRRKASRRRLRG